MRPCYHALLRDVTAGSVWALEARAAEGMPVQPMSASPVRDVHEALERMHGQPSFLIERKYDGERCQLHLLGSRGSTYHPAIARIDAHQLPPCPIQ